MKCSRPYHVWFTGQILFIIFMFQNIVSLSVNCLVLKLSVSLSFIILSCLSFEEVSYVNFTFYQPFALDLINNRKKELNNPEVKLYVSLCVKFRHHSSLRFSFYSYSNMIILSLISNFCSVTPPLYFITNTHGKGSVRWDLFTYKKEDLTNRRISLLLS